MTQKAIGPTFPAELEAAGLTGLPFAWSVTGDFYFDDRMTADELASVQAVYSAHDPSKKLPPPAASGT